MAKKYVIFHNNTRRGNELYLKGVRDMLPSVTHFSNDAMGFSTPREAYEFGGRNRLLDWRVGARQWH